MPKPTRRHYVSHKRKGDVAMPRDAWVGPVFREADGTELDVCWNGDKAGPMLCRGIDRRGNHLEKPARIHLPKGRS